MVGADADLGLWDLRMVHDQLAGLALAWDQPAPAVASAGEMAAMGHRSRPGVAVISAPEHALIEVLNGAIESRPDDPSLRFERGNLLAQSGQWKAALDDYREGLARDASDTIPWMGAAALYLQLGDVQGYRRHARAMLEKFAATDDPANAERTAKIGALTAPPPEEATRLTTLADLAVTKGADSPPLPWYQLARGMAAYREDKFQDAANWLQKVRDSTGSTAPCKTAALLFLAMSQSRLEELGKARESLESARGSLKAKTPDSWHDWLICEIALREAETVIGQQTPSPVSSPARDP
jgi:tetratricopeptide (TPR) repeat protein